MGTRKAGKIIYRAIICVAITMAMTCNKTIEVNNFTDFVRANKSCMGIGPAIILALMYYFFSKNHFSYNRKDSISLAVLAGVLSQCYWLGFRLDNGIEIVVPSLFGIMQWITASGGYAILFYYIGCLLFKRIDGFSVTCGQKIEEKERKNSFLYSFIICDIVWGIYYLLFFPGVVTNDTYWQINQALGFEPLSNHHPFMHTLLEALFLRPAYYGLHNTKIGIAAFILFQLIIMSLITAYLQSILCDLGVGKKVRTATLVFYAANPLFGMYSVTMWKDIWMGMLTLWMLLLLVRIVITGNRSGCIYLLLSISMAGVYFAKATGLAIITLTLIAIIFLFWKGKNVSVKMIALMAGTLVVCITIQSVAINIFGVIPSESRESKSIPLQQIARTVKENGESISEEDKTIINEILPYDELADRYNPRLSDPVKNTFNEINFNKDKRKYFFLWLSLGIQHPATYIKSFLSNTYGYWYPDTDYWVATSQSYEMFLNDSKYVVYDEYISKYDLSEDSSERRLNILNSLFSIRRVPGLSLFFSTGAFFWGYLILAVWARRHKNTDIILPLAIALAVFITCLMSPLYCEMRYAYPAVIIFPLALIIGIRKTESDIEENRKH